MRQAPRQALRQLIGVGAVCAAMVCGAVSLLAQHTLAAKFDLTKPMTLTGTVTQVDWANPYVHVLMKVPGQPLPVLWAVEVEGPIILAANGWSETSLAPGEAIRVEGFVARDGSKQISGRSVTVSRTGRPVYVGVNGTPRPRPVATGPAPRWPDGRPRLGPPPGQTGYWGFPSRGYLVEDGVSVQADQYGLLSNAADAAKVAPLQPWALAIYRMRQSTFLQRDPMLLWCKPPGGPRQFQQVYGFQFVEQPDFKRVFVLLGGGNRNRRTIYTDGRKHVGQVGGNDDNPLYYGHGVARWDGDAFVVDNRGFIEDFWFDNGGLPHTEQLQMTERFTRVDMATLRYEVTINDPGAYTRPWKSTWNLNWVPGEELPYFLCQDNRP
jgi:hypothetical protein